MARLLTLFLSLLTGTSAVLAARPNAEPVKPPIPGAYIFEFEDGKVSMEITHCYMLSIDGMGTSDVV